MHTCMDFLLLEQLSVYSTLQEVTDWTFSVVLSSCRACDTLFDGLHLLRICAKLAS